MTQRPVLIAGGGPVGMALAIELGTRGIATVVIEGRARGETFPARSNLTNARSMEHFRRWGIADRLRENDPVPGTFQRDVTFVTRLNGKVLINIEGGCEWRERLAISSELPEWAPNQGIEKTLREKIEDLPMVDFRWQSETLSFTQDDESVELRYRDPRGSERTVAGCFLAIAEGSRSKLRRQLNVPLHGASLADNTAWMVHAPTLVDLYETPVSSFTWFINEDAHADVLVPQKEDHYLYLCSPLPAGVDGDDWEAIKRLLFRSVGVEFPVEPVHGGAWKTQSRMAPRYDYGRAFLIGDSAHLTSPMGGFGMNMGIGDAVDLGWKLAATLAGWGGPRLLETYSIERQEAERFIIDGSTHNQSILAPQMVRPHMEEDSERGEAARAEVRDLIVNEKSKEFASFGAQFGYRYATSPIIVLDGTEEPPPEFGTYAPSARPGNLAPHLWLGDTSLYDTFGAGFTLLRLDPAADAAPLQDAAAALDVPLATVELDSDEARGLYAARLALVRPDQHVAWRGDELPADCAGLLDAVRGARGTRLRAA